MGIIIYILYYSYNFFPSFKFFKIKYCWEGRKIEVQPHSDLKSNPHTHNAESGVKKLAIKYQAFTARLVKPRSLPARAARPKPVHVLAAEVGATWWQLSASA